MAGTDHLGGRASERDLLTGMLDWYRGVVDHKLAGLASADAAASMTPSGLSPLGIVKHLGYVERGWFRLRFAGDDVEVPHVDGDNAVQFRLEPGETSDAVVAFYREECDHARRIAAGASLDELSVREHPVFGLVTLRWILMAMIAETARHAGHLDLMREKIDGVTGD